jgi:hypothetical protein
VSVDSVRVRLAVAAPISLVYAFAVMAAVSVLPSALTAVGAVMLIAGPPIGAAWLLVGSNARMRAVASVLSLMVSVSAIAAIVLGALPLFQVPGVGISEPGVYAMVYAPILVLGAVCVALRGRDGRTDATLVKTWSAALVLLLLGERLVAALTTLAGADAISGSLAFLGAPSVGLATFVGVAGGAGFRVAGARKPARRYEMQSGGGDEG